MDVLVTGGAGFIGSHFVRKALGNEFVSWVPDKLTVLDKLTYAGNTANLAPVAGDPRYRFVRGDITDPRLVAELMAEHDVVVHFAAESHVDRSIDSGAEFITTNVLGTQNLLEAAVRHGVRQFLHVSTDEVYGSIELGSWPETDPLAPNSPYAASKAASDLVALAYHRTHSLDVRITRCSNNYGPYQYPEKVIPRFVTNLIDGKTVPLYGDGLNVRDWLHVDDHCRGIVAALSKGRPGEIYNIGGGREITNQALTSALLRELGLGADRIEWVADRKAHDRRYSVDWNKSRREIGYEPEINFTTGLADTVRWYLDNREWWQPLLAEH